MVAGDSGDGNSEQWQGRARARARTNPDTKWEDQQNGHSTAGLQGVTQSNSIPKEKGGNRL